MDRIECQQKCISTESITQNRIFPFQHIDYTHLQRLTGTDQMIDGIQFILGHRGPSVSSHQNSRRVLNDHEKQEQQFELLRSGIGAGGCILGVRNLFGRGWSIRRRVERLHELAVILLVHHAVAGVDSVVKGGLVVLAVVHGFDTRG